MAALTHVSISKSKDKRIDAIEEHLKANFEFVRNHPNMVTVYKKDGNTIKRVEDHSYNVYRDKDGKEVTVMDFILDPETGKVSRWNDPEIK